MRDAGAKLLEWYFQNKRELPWRETSKPYFIWISEIVLQQTRVDQGMDYYLRFVERFPNVEILAKASEEEVLKYWQGLGYYSRARNLHFSAKYIWNELGGKFPETYEEIMKLKGVGPYTAAAISSIAFNLPYPVIDGNVMRIISRIFGIDQAINSSAGEKEIKKAIDQIFDKEQPGNFNQAMMEFGALHCTPKNPLCENCILKHQCVAFNQGLVAVLPVKIKAQKPKDWFLNYLVITDKQDNILVRKRENSGIWKNMYDFPSFDTQKQIDGRKLVQTKEFKTLINEQPFTILSSQILKHQLSHKNIFAHFYHIEVEQLQMLSIPPETKKEKQQEIKKFPLPKLIVSYLKTWHSS